MFFIIVIALAFGPLSRSTAVGLECYSCTNATMVANCNTATKCQEGEICHADVSTHAGVTRYTLGCKSYQTCLPNSIVSTSSGSGTIVGRAVGTGSCSECCETGMCNRQLCQNNDSSCSDVTPCSAIGMYSNICDDVDHMKLVCKRYCGFCNLVDGSWSPWTTWSDCGVTCGNGTKTRTRSCSDPAPANGGTTCAGSHQDTATCTSSNVCPVPGGWSTWSAWGSCSSSCDIGMQRRDRSCSNPFPSNGGDYCYGDARDDRLCLPGPCAHGHWSQWNSWSTCSATCGGGLTSRSRACDNPAPSITGRYCVGNPQESQVCNNNDCLPTVAFTAQGLTNTSTPQKGDIIKYENIIMNTGNGYSSSTGYFTAPVSGTYLFNVHICGSSGFWFRVYIKVQGQTVGSAFYAENDIDKTCTSGTGVAHMSKGDKAWIADAGSYIHDTSDQWNSFSGVLVGA